jgi:hypothetical protein
MRSALLVIKGSAKLDVVPMDCIEVTALPFCSQLVVWATDAGVTHVGALAAPLDCNIYPVVPALLLGINAPLKRTLPVTSSACVGLVLRIPTLPFVEDATRSTHALPFQK